MTRGLTRQQIGISESLIDSFGELIFLLSHNHQVRRGDPIRLKDFSAIEEQRPVLGMSDTEIASRVGLSKDQVTTIRNIVERRKLRTNTHLRLNDLGGGRRFRDERFTPYEERPTYTEDAMSLKKAMTFDAEQVQGFIEKSWWGGETLRSLLEHKAVESPEAPAIIGAGEVLTYAELVEKVRRLAAGLYRLGIRPGDVVGVQLPNIADYLVAYFATTWHGGVMTTVYLPYGEKETETLLSHSRARAFICPTDISGYDAAATVLAISERLPALKHVIARGDKVPGCVSFADLASSPPLETEVNIPVGSDPFLLLYTSGTTANPKGVPQSYQTMLSNARLGAPEHGFTANDCLMSAAPFGHLFALYSVHLALTVGGSVALLPVFTPPDLMQAIETLKPTGLFAAPAHIAACLGGGLFDRHDASSLRVAILSGSPLQPELAQTFDQQLPKIKVTQLWGMTETQAGLYTRPEDPIELVARCAGRPSPGTEVRIADADGTESPQGEEGELQVRGCLLFPGYFNNEDANHDAFTANGWFRTGDLAIMDTDGNVSITGRIKDIINRGGVKYNPRDVEELLDRHPKVGQSAIVPVPDEVLGERACAFVTLASGKEVTLQELCNYLLENKIAKLKLPEQLEVIEEMPLTATRKIIKGRLHPKTSD
jgi:non-ribosomal peptide synthetase component E (peptide arylation enzyme)|tara:strand:- start:106 stop:2073 length:1968 start_codon:yes stop_codon:yes gene_type:complete